MVSALSDGDKARIEAAVAEIEARSAAEIVVVTTHASHDYAEGIALSAALIALLAGGLAALLLPIGAAMVVAGQMGLFALLWAVWTFARAGHWLTPHRVKLAHARHAAAMEFAKLVNAQTSDRRGLLIYLSLAERHIEIIADRGIAAAIPDARWQEIVAAFPAAVKSQGLGEALLGVVRQSGALLATAFPPEPGQRNELSDGVVER
ncbi:MAG TPA: TPM domain-containing protein [Alphaproteobacteria bacterium]|jgi:putative membrane protein